MHRRYRSPSPHAVSASKEAGVPAFSLVANNDGAASSAHGASGLWPALPVRSAARGRGRPRPASIAGGVSPRPFPLSSGPRPLPRLRDRSSASGRRRHRARPDRTGSGAAVTERQGCDTCCEPAVDEERRFDARSVPVYANGISGGEPEAFGIVGRKRSALPQFRPSPAWDIPEARRSTSSARPKRLDRAAGRARGRLLPLSRWPEPTGCRQAPARQGVRHWPARRPLGPFHATRTRSRRFEMVRPRSGGQDRAKLSVRR